MPTLSWNEIKARAIAFSKEWQHEGSEDAEAKSFLDSFFNVFGVSRRRFASFESKVKKIDGKDGFIDLLWKGVILVEMKSRGKDLDRALQQAKDYFPGLKDSELPKYILVCDFERFRLYDLETEGNYHEFALTELLANVQHFGFLAGYQKREFKEEDPVNIKAAELMGKLHDELKAVGYEGHPLELYLVRLLFCLFADDTSIFEKSTFYEFVSTNTREDGSDLGAQLAQLFQILNTPDGKRMKSLDETLAAFPYINGKLFEEALPIASFTSSMRSSLLNAAALDWGKISPAIFGSLFQSVLNPEQRRNLGAHYTSEKNILKVIKPLFLDELHSEFATIGTNKKKLEAFHDKLSKLTFLDPACGCGNFLIIAYRELRELEIQVVKKLLGKQLVNVNQYLKVDVDQFYGIEYDEFPSQIAQVAIWLMDHQMNMRASEEFGEYYVRLPLRKSATIVHGNALRTEWKDLHSAFDFIFGNPPFIGSKMMTQEQRDDVVRCFNSADGTGSLDYVTAWYIKAAHYIQTTRSKVAFVSTNSISQGEQVGILWQQLYKYGIQIHFAHRTFKWSNEARGVAAVYCVIIGFGNSSVQVKRLFEYDTVKSDPHELEVENINPYLVDASNIVLRSTQNHIQSFVPKIGIGNKPIDNGQYLFTDSDKDVFISSEPQSEKYFRRWIGSDEFLNGYNRWCLFIRYASPTDLRLMPLVLERIENVRQFRAASKSEPTKKLSETPTKFHVENFPENTYLVIPKVSSERRRYIPIGFEEVTTLASDLLFVVNNATLYHFGVLSSTMHNAWVRYTCGRLKSDYRYSKDIVYNNFPWAENVSAKQQEAVEKAAQAVLDARAKYPTSSLADLYDPLTMPPELVKAHNTLDKAVDQCYRKEAFASESHRIAFLFELYERYTAGLFATEGKKKS